MKNNNCAEQPMSVKETVINGFKEMRSHLKEESKNATLSLKDKESMINGLNKVQGSIDDIKDMVAGNQGYYDILKQIETSRRALNKLETVALEKYAVSFS